MLVPSIRVTQPRLLQETVQTLRKFGLSISSLPASSTLTISPFPASKSSYIHRKVGQSHPPVPPLLVPNSTSPARNLSLLQKLGSSAPGPFFAVGKAGQINAALFAAACLATRSPKIRRTLQLFRARQTNSVPQTP